MKENFKLHVRNQKRMALKGIVITEILLIVERLWVNFYPLTHVSHLTLEDGNFNVAVDLLTKEFQDVPRRVHEIFKQTRNSI